MVSWSWSSHGWSRWWCFVILLPVWIQSFSWRHKGSTTRRFTTQILALDSSTLASTIDTTSWFDSFAQTFSGDFDNYDQVVTDRLAGSFPREGGGHEHIHCTLVPISPHERLAAFYFDGNPNNIFRFRYYHYQLVVDDYQQPKQIDMMLYTIHPDLELEFRQESDPMKWIDLWTAACRTTTVANLVTLLPNCDVQWSTTPDPIQHWYHISDQSGFHAIMTYGEALVKSQRDPNVLILVRDQLSLLDNEFWIHDRGYNPDTMEFIYGNQNLIPYQLKRVTQIQTDTTMTRLVSNDNLQWTLGPAYRTEEEYQQKLSDLGKTHIKN